MANSNLTEAKRAKNDEFYTQYGMYARDFEDLDGHVWGLCYLDRAKMPAGGAT